jgi:hypothetical protein
MIRAQYSMEFILVFAFSLLIIIPLISLLHSEYWESKEILDESQAKEVLDEMALTIQNTYYAGYPSRTTLELYFPRGITDIRSITKVMSDGRTISELIFDFQKGGSISNLVQPFPFEISTNLTSTDGTRRILIKAQENKSSQKTFVNISDFNQ